MRIWKVLVPPVVVAVLAIALLAGRLGELPRAHADGVGGQISIGTPFLSSGKIVVPVLTTATTDTYSGLNVHLVWDPTLLSTTLSGFASGGVLETNAGGFGVGCSALLDAGGGGVYGTCNIQGNSPITSAGTLVNITLTPQVTQGCANLHLFQYGGVDGGDSTTGTFTIDSTSTVQSVTYGPDVTVNLSSGTTGCVAAPTPTATVTNTPPAGATVEATMTPTPVNTPVGGYLTVTPTVTPITATPSATAAAGAPPPPPAGGGQQGAPAPATSGGPGGEAAVAGARVPKAGTGSATGDGAPRWLALALAMSGILVASIAMTSRRTARVTRRPPRP